MKPIMALDIGTKHIGVAISYSHTMATPVDVLSDKKDSLNQLQKLAAIIAKERVDIVIVGYPARLSDGAPTKMGDFIDNFVVKLKGYLKAKNHRVEFIYEDEALTSWEADNISSKRKNDDVSAVLILESYLSRVKNK